MYARGAGVLAALGLLLAAGCSSPLYDSRDEELRQSLRAFSERELEESQRRPAPRQTARESRAESLRIAPDILAEIQRTSGPQFIRSTAPTYDKDLLGQTQTIADVSLRRAVMTGIRNNLGVQFARLGPAIDEARVTAAEAVFDWTLFGSTQMSKNNEPRVVTNASTPTEIDTTATSGTIGVRRRLVTGGRITAQTSATLNKDQLDPIPFTYNPSPNPAKQADLTLQLDQPLLRDFGSDVNLSQVRIERNAARDQVQQLRQTLERTVVDVEEAYWQLVASVANLRINQKLLERGLEVQDILIKRRDARLDVKQSQLSDAVAQVEARRADVIRAENQVRISSDRLKQLVNDPAAPVGGELLLQPVDMPSDEPITFSLVESLATAMNNRTEVQRALLAIDDASIRQALANNQRLPELNLRAQVRLTGQSSDFSSAYTDLSDADFVNALIGLNFEQPIGNRAAEANFKSRSLERMQSVIAYKDVAQRIVGDVKERLRTVDANYKLIEQTRAARIAAAENLRTLLVEEQNLAALTPEFLDLKLRRQQAMASAEVQEIVAITDYNSAVARLYGSMGTALRRNRVDFHVPTAEEAMAAGATGRVPDSPIVTPTGDSGGERDPDRISTPRAPTRP